MAIQVSAFRWVPPFARGLVRDLRVRWALEETGLPYETTLIDPQIQGSARYRQWQPFGQVPAYKDDRVELFESGAIVLHIANKSKALMPADEAGRARATMWVIGALNTLEPVLMSMVQIDVFHAGEAWTTQRRPQVQEMLDRRLSELSACLEGKDYLEDRFTAGDLITSAVLREVTPETMARFPILDAYRKRCEARPAFGRALAAQLADFSDDPPQ